MDDLLADIDAFLAAHDMAPTRFGDDAMSDRHLVRQLRAGRRLWPETEKKVRDFMASFSASAAQASSGKAQDISAEVVS